MQKLKLLNESDDTKKVLCIGAHCDDIEIGCGGTLLQMLHQNVRLDVYWFVACSTQERKNEAENSAGFFLKNAHGRKVIIKDFKDGFLPHYWAEVKQCFEEMKREFAPDLIFTHYRDDRHQDHRVLSDLAWNTFRNHLILEYEIPKYDGDFGAQNCFVHLDEDVCNRKVDAIVTHFASQRKKHWFSKETIFAVARLRGMEAGGEQKYAEGFYGRKLLL